MLSLKALESHDIIHLLMLILLLPRTKQFKALMESFIEGEICLSMYMFLVSPGLSQSLGGAPGKVLVPGLSSPLLLTHQQCPVEPWH